MFQVYSHILVILNFHLHYHVFYSALQSVLNEFFTQLHYSYRVFQYYTFHRITCWLTYPFSFFFIWNLLRHFFLWFLEAVQCPWFFSLLIYLICQKKDFWLLTFTSFKSSLRPHPMQIILYIFYLPISRRRRAVKPTLIFSVHLL